MPELHFTVRWPDGSLDRCYSPSGSVRDYLEAGTTYPLEDFLGRTRDALEHAGERVRLRYGFRCASAAEQLEQIEVRAGAFHGSPEPQVTVVGFGP